MSQTSALELKIDIEENGIGWENGPSRPYIREVFTRKSPSPIQLWVCYFYQQAFTVYLLQGGGRGGYEGGRKRRVEEEGSF